MQSAKSGVSRVLGLPAKLISVPEATIRGCHVLTVTLISLLKGSNLCLLEGCKSSYNLGTFRKLVKGFKDWG
jgi:hypothetical protein